MFQNIKQNNANVFQGKIKRSYVSLMTLEIEKEKKKKRMDIFEDKLSQVMRL